MANFYADVLGSAAIAALTRDVRLHGVAHVARELQLHRSTIASVLAGTARVATAARVASRLAERSTPPGGMP